MNEMHDFVEQRPSTQPYTGCLKCGRSREWHQVKAPLYAHDKAKTWLESKNLHKQPVSNLYLSILTEYIKDQTGEW